ncbi:MAG: rubredoxin [Burkholderiaceae bacterium]|nr:rubredoxin [Burkholderiaceae bacterium]
MARYQCPDCGYVYDEQAGCAREGYPAGTTWKTLPEAFPCPDCIVREKPDFVALDAATEAEENKQ